MLGRPAPTDMMWLTYYLLKTIISWLRPISTTENCLSLIAHLMRTEQSTIVRGGRKAINISNIVWLIIIFFESTWWKTENLTKVIVRRTNLRTHYRDAVKLQKLEDLFQLVQMKIWYETRSTKSPWRYWFVGSKHRATSTCMTDRQCNIVPFLPY